MARVTALRGRGSRLSAVGSLLPSPCSIGVACVSILPGGLGSGGLSSLRLLCDGHFSLAPLCFVGWFSGQARSGSPMYLAQFCGHGSLFGHGSQLGAWWCYWWVVIVGGTAVKPDLVCLEPDLTGALVWPNFQGCHATVTARKVWVVALSPELVPVARSRLSGVGSSLSVFSSFLSGGVGFVWIVNMLFLCFLTVFWATRVGFGWCCTVFFTGVGHVEITTFWVRSSRFTGHCSSLGSHSALVQSSVLPWPCLYERFCEACGCESHWFRNSSETVGPYYLTSFDLSIKIGSLFVARSCVIIWRFVDPSRSFGSRPNLWSWTPLLLCNPTR